MGQSDLSLSLLNPKFMGMFSAGLMALRACKIVKRKGDKEMALSGEESTFPTVTGLLDEFPFGRVTSVGVLDGFWSGVYRGTSDGAGTLTTAQLYNDSGAAVGVVQREVQIPLNRITFVV